MIDPTHERPHFPAGAGLVIRRPSGGNLGAAAGPARRAERLRRPAARIAALAALSAAVLAATTGCPPAAKPPQEAAQLVAAAAEEIPLDPHDAAWQRALPFRVPLLVQDIVEPRLLAPTTPEIRVRALRDGSRLAFHLAWDDPTKDDVPGPDLFSDACAIQLPARLGPALPAPQMGEPNLPVEMVFWKAAWQATVDGRGDSLRDLYPHAAVDHYPFEAASLESGSPAQAEMAARYAPARAVGNPVAGPRERAVEVLVAEGPGSVEPAPSIAADGRGAYDAGGWAVVIVRPLPEGVSPDVPAYVAFAVWDGTHKESGARKMRTAWIPLHVEAAP